MENTKSQTTNPGKYILTDPPFAQALFGDVRLSWIWLIVRLYVGYKWLVAGWDKINNPSWVGAIAAPPSLDSLITPSR